MRGPDLDEDEDDMWASLDEDEDDPWARPR